LLVFASYFSAGRAFYCKSGKLNPVCCRLFSIEGACINPGFSATFKASNGAEEGSKEKENGSSYRGLITLAGRTYGAGVISGSFELPFNKGS